MDLTGNAIIFGGGGGIGRATAMTMARSGVAGVLLADINLKAAQQVAEDATSVATHPEFRAEAREADVTKQESVDATFDEMVDSFKRIDYCVNCAGLEPQSMQPAAHADVAEFLRLQSVNVNGTFFVIRKALLVMEKQEAEWNDPKIERRGMTKGAIVALGSAFSVNAAPQCVQYIASKHAVVGIVKGAALDYARKDIRINCVCPSWTETDMAVRVRKLSTMMEEVMVPSVPMGRLGAPEEAADAVLFLCSPRASLITGATFMADGGITASLGIALS